MAPVLYTADCLKLLPTLDSASFDACVTDPPYELGFMGKAWDRSGVAHDAATWRHVLRVLKPGAHLLAFGGSRTYHRLVCALEDAGFEIRDCIMWLYGEGYPKSKQLGEGLGTGIKPAHEPIVLARRPLDHETVTKTHEAWGTCALRIDECRVSAEVEASCGRWPANVVLDAAAAAALDEQAGRPVSRFFYCPKASARERDAGLEDLPTVATHLMQGLNAADPRRANHHPSVKPIALMRYLCRLVTPTGGRVLDPFTGSGSTGVAAALEQLEFVGIEQDPGYARIAAARIDAAKG